MASRRDMLVVIAAGNDGTAVSTFVPPRPTPGFPDWLSIGAPATSKNALVVGASRSSRTTGGYAADTWSTRFASRFPTPDGISGETISGDPRCLAGFSSRGPCMDMRIKPDVVAPGTDIVSARAANANPANFWGPYTNPKYAYMGGTSMAAPLVAGCAALVRQYFVQERQHAPSAALLKATLVNGTRWLDGPDAIDGHAVQPNYHQGFGMVHMPTTIPNGTMPALRLEFVDPWDDQSAWLANGRARRWVVDVRAGTPLHICLAYTDIPGSGLQNRLNLFAEEPVPAGGGLPRKRLGNEDLPDNALRLPDPFNNVQVVRVAKPEAGQYLIKLVATSLLKPQDFALVVTGDLAGPLMLA